MFLVLKGKYIMFLAVVTVIVFSAIFGTISISVFENDDNYRVILDAGHGEPDGGAVGSGGTLEKDINLSIVLKTKEVLEGKGIEVILTRMGDNALYDDENSSIREKKRSDMNTRRSIMENSDADLFVSIHMNSFESKSANGLHVFYAKNHPETETLAAEIQTRIAEITKAETHSIKTADENLFLMKKPPIGALLIECGFLSNPEEEKKLNTEEYQNKIAWAIAEAIDEYKPD